VARVSFESGAGLLNEEGGLETFVRERGSELLEIGVGGGVCRRNKNSLRRMDRRNKTHRIDCSASVKPPEFVYG
jgi:hypothetical protein